MKQTVANTNKSVEKAPKHNRKRLIASMLAGALLAGGLTISTISGSAMYKITKLNHKIDDLNEDLARVATTIKADSSFQQYYTDKYLQYTNAYANNIIDFDTYTAKLEYLDSVAFVDEYVISTDNNIDTSEFVSIKQNINTATNEKEQLVQPTLLGIIFGLASMGSGAGVAQQVINENERERKAKMYLESEQKSREALDKNDGVIRF